jgi:hypothetical protein
MHDVASVVGVVKRRRCRCRPRRSVHPPQASAYLPRLSAGASTIVRRRLAVARHARAYPDPRRRRRCLLAIPTHRVRLRGRKLKLEDADAASPVTRGLIGAPDWRSVGESGGCAARTPTGPRSQSLANGGESPDPDGLGGCQCQAWFGGCPGRLRIGIDVRRAVTEDGRPRRGEEGGGMGGWQDSAREGRARRR